MPWAVLKSPGRNHPRVDQNLLPGCRDPGRRQLPDRHRLRAPLGIDAKAGNIRRGLRIQAIVHPVDQDLHLDLGLHKSPS